MPTLRRSLVAAAVLVALPAVAFAQIQPRVSSGQTFYVEELKASGTELIAKGQLLRYIHKVAVPRQAGSLMATGSRIYDPITIVRRVDGASPLLFKALVQNQVVELKIRAYSGETRQHEIVITAGRVASYEQQIEAGVLVEVVTFTFSNITHRSPPTGTEHADSINDSA